MSAHSSMTAVSKTNKGWLVSTSESLSDFAAQAITFKARPEDVVLGEYVEVEDADGSRIARVSRATLVRRLHHPNEVLVEIEVL